MEAATAQLEARLSREGGTPDDWRLLAQSYDFLGRTDDARRARARADSAAPAAPASTRDSLAWLAVADAQRRQHELTARPRPLMPVMPFGRVASHVSIVTIRLL